MTTPIVSSRQEAAIDPADHLESLEVSLQERLGAMPATSLEAVEAAHRANIERNLEEVRIARRRLAEGLYGVCVGCSDAISAGRLEVRPAATRCTGCAARPAW